MCMIYVDWVCDCGYEYPCDVGINSPGWGHMWWADRLRMYRAGVFMYYAGLGICFNIGMFTGRWVSMVVW